MDKKSPLVSIGIPTYNRSVFLKRTIESVLNQDYGNIEVIVSDNASTDETESICEHYCNMDTRFRYIQQLTNRGPTANFMEVLNNASGQFFMWLGDDDWIDKNYISSCVQQLISDPTIGLVSGLPQYYHSGEKLFDGNVFSLLHNIWWHRVISYYLNVADNGMFYGVMPTELIRNIGIPATMGGDWIMLANIVTIRKAKMMQGISVHRELGGATASYQNIANIVGLPRVQAMFPYTFIAYKACINIMINRQMLKYRSVFTRVAVALSVFFIIFIRRLILIFDIACRRIKNNLLSIE